MPPPTRLPSPIPVPSFVVPALACVVLLGACAHPPAGDAHVGMRGEASANQPTASAPLREQAGAAAPGVAGVFERTLPNGMKVVVREDRRAPTVVHLVLYRAGSMDEVNGRTGVAHVLEHMMFKGTKTVPQGEFSRRVAALGGRENAFTSRDYTGYFQQLASRHLADVMKLEADRMSNLVITAEEFDKEARVVMEERRLRTEDRAQSLVYEQLMSTAWTASPYRRPVIGWMNDLESMRAEDAAAWYRDWYTPANAILVVAGDVSGEEVYRLAEGTYGYEVADVLDGLTAEDADGIVLMLDTPGGTVTGSKAIADAVDRMKSDAQPAPLIAVGGGAFLVPDTLPGVSEVVRVPHQGVANALGAAIAQVSGEVDQIFRDLPREAAMARARELAEARAVRAGAAAATLKLVEMEDIPLAYLPGNSLRVRARVVGDVA